MDIDLSFLAEKINGAKRPEDIFGNLSGSSEEQKEQIRSAYRQLSRSVHPDKFAGSDLESQCLAGKTMGVLNNLYSEAQKRVDSTVYGSENSLDNGSQEFNVGNCNYRIFSDSIMGDFSQVYFGERTDHQGQTEQVCIKVAKTLDENDLLKKEAGVLRAISHKSLPSLVEHFMFEDQRVVNTFRKIEDSYDLHSLREYFPKGLSQEHGVWVMDRLLSVLGYLHSNSIIHGSVEPGNILVRPRDHNSFLIDFALSIQNATQETTRYGGLNDFSAPEIDKNSRPHPTTDIYSLGKTMVYLLGGQDNDLPKGIDPRIKDYLSGFLREDPQQRKDDAWKAFHELKDLRTEIFGAPSQFLPLDVS